VDEYDQTTSVPVAQSIILLEEYHVRIEDKDREVEVVHHVISEMG